MKKIIRFFLRKLWTQYTKDKRVIYSKRPIGDSIFSAEGFLHWLLSDAYERKVQNEKTLS